jgi:ArsR family transcriptional regulator, arsenate/arsenite/antimonite-responsive transcriptional repressor
MNAEITIRALAALAQEHRLAAFRLLVQAGDAGLAAGAIADSLGVPASSMSFHLAQLGHAGLVNQRRESRSIIYTADYVAMNGLMGYLTENCCAGVPCTEDAGCSPAATTERNAA